MTGRDHAAVMAELAALIPPPGTPPTPAPSGRGFDWVAWDRARDDADAAMGEPDLIDGWLMVGRRARRYAS